MRLSIAFLLFLLSPNLFSQTNVTYRGAYTFPGVELANLWGYADGNGNEYALVGTQKGMSIIDVTVPTSPSLVIDISGPFSDWREIKTYGHYAYVVTEGTAGPKKGLTIVDLSQLPNIDTNNINHVHTYRGDGAILNQLNRAHALHVDETTGYLYLYGSNLNQGGPLMFNLNPNPSSPVYAGFVNNGFTGNNYNYVHDGYVDNNRLYAAHISGGFFSIINTTVKTNPVLIETQNTPTLYTHNTWLSGSTLFTTDENTGSYLAAYDVSNTNNIRLLDKIRSNPGGGSIVHNTYIINNYAVTSWYKDGFTIVDALRPDNLVQVGNYDTYPGGSGNGFFGCWGVYPYLPSGNIIASNINEAPGNSNGKLFVLTPNYVRGCYLEGIVTDAVNGNPINGATVEIQSTPVNSENSGSDGKYKMGQVTSGMFTIKATKANYQAFSTNISLSNGVLTTLNIPMQPLVLPVELLRFTVRPEGNTALLDWETASEHNNKGFEVQHSTDGTSWKEAGFVPAKGDGQSAATYTFELGNLKPGTQFFRLRPTDLDGTSTFSEVKSITIGGQKMQVHLQPTIVSDQCELTISSPTPANVRVEIFRADGSSTGQVWTLAVENDYVLSFSASTFTSGSYFAVLQSEQEKVVAPFWVK